MGAWPPNFFPLDTALFVEVISTVHFDVYLRNDQGLLWRVKQYFNQCYSFYVMSHDIFSLSTYVLILFHKS